MTGISEQPARAVYQHGQPGAAGQILVALSMTVGRGRAARAVAEVAGPRDEDVVLDIGCGPGTAVREARYTTGRTATRG
jgi:hypothetical protein